MRILIVTIASLLLLAMPNAGLAQGEVAEGHLTKETIYQRLSSNLMCLCGCQTTLKTCPHVICSFAIPARKQILSLLDDGATYEQVVTTMVSKHGQQVLAAPPKEGFNLVGYLLPFVAILAVGAIVIRLVSIWSKKNNAVDTNHPIGACAGTPDSVDIDAHEKMKKELEEFD